MAENQFDYDFWMNRSKAAAKNSNSGQVNNLIVAATRAALPTEDLFQQVDALVSEVVNRGIDLTQGYVPWRNIGFALAEGMGNQGRGYFHTLSAQNPDYNEAECDKQFDACLKAHGCGITINTLFHAAKCHCPSVQHFADFFANSSIWGMRGNGGCYQALQTDF